MSASECKKVVKEFGETVAELNAKEESNEVLALLESKVASFKSKIPCIEYLRTPQLKDRCSNIFPSLARLSATRPKPYIGCCWVAGENWPFSSVLPFHHQPFGAGTGLPSRQLLETTSQLGSL